MRDRISSMGITGAAAAITGFFLLIMAAAPPSFAATDWDVGISGGSHGIDGFHLSIGEYYDVPEREVVVIHDRGIDDDELPVVFFISRHAHVPPEVIVDMRIRGMSWMDITFHYGLGPEIYYVPVEVYDGHHHHHPPYGNAWGYYRKYPHKKDWRKIHLTDHDVVNQVNLGFMKNHYRYAPDRVMEYRSGGKRYSAIDREIWRERHGQSRDNYYTDRDWRKGNDRNWDKGKQKQYDRNDMRRAEAENHMDYSHGGGYDKGDKGKGGKDKGGNKHWQEEEGGGKGHK